MLRLTVSLTVLIAVVATCSEVMAQRRAPLRNLARQIGVRWSAGYHNYNPGPATDYYSPWSSTNQPSSQTITPGNDSYFNNGQPTPAIQPQIQDATAPADPENSAIRILNQPANRNWNQAAPGNQTNNAWPNSNSTNWQNNQRINQQLQPWRNSGSSTTTGQSISIPEQGVSSGNQWDTRYNREFEQSQPFIPGSR